MEHEKSTTDHHAINEKMSQHKERFAQAQPTDEEMQAKVIEQLKQIFDPELPVNIYDLGLIYEVTCWTDERSLLKQGKIVMTLTSATCSFSNVIIDLVESIPSRLEGLEALEVNVVFDPPWNQDQMSDEAKLAMGML